MKILQINAVYGVGSTGNITMDIANQLSQQGHQAYVMWAIKSKCTDDSIELIRIGNLIDHKIHAAFRRISGKQGWYSLRATKKACELILKISPDVVHLHNLHSNYINLPYLLDFLGKNNIPTVITMHDCWNYTGGCVYYAYHNCNGWTSGCKNCPAIYEKYSRVAKDILEAKNRLFSKINKLAVVGVSKWTENDAKKSILSNSAVITHIYNWINTDVFSPMENTTEIRKKYNIPQDHKVILGVSQEWTSEKGLDAFLSLSEQVPEGASIVLVGGGKNVPDKNNVICVGYLKNLSDLVGLYSTASVFVNPSTADTFGLVSAEAMSCGTPIVAYNNPGAVEVVDKNCGILVENGNEKALISAVNRIILEEKSEYSAVCRKWVCDNFDKDTQIQKYIELYKEISRRE